MDAQTIVLYLVAQLRGWAKQSRFVPQSRADWVIVAITIFVGMTVLDPVLPILLCGALWLIHPANISRVEHRTFWMCTVADVSCLTRMLRLNVDGFTPRWPFIFFFLAARVGAILDRACWLKRRLTPAENGRPPLRFLLACFIPLTEVAQSAPVPLYSEQAVPEFIARSLDAAESEAGSKIDMVRLQRYTVRLAALVRSIYATKRRQCMQDIAADHIAREAWAALDAPILDIAPAPPPMSLHSFCALSVAPLVLVDCIEGALDPLSLVTVLAALGLWFDSAAYQRNERARAAFAMEELDALNWLGNKTALPAIARSRAQLLVCLRARETLSSCLPCEVVTLVLQFREALPEFDEFIVKSGGTELPSAAPRPRSTAALLTALAALNPARPLTANACSFLSTS